MEDWYWYDSLFLRESKYSPNDFPDDGGNCSIKNQDFLFGYIYASLGVLFMELIYKLWTKTANKTRGRKPKQIAQVGLALSAVRHLWWGHGDHGGLLFLMGADFTGVNKTFNTDTNGVHCVQMCQRRQPNGFKAHQSKHIDCLLEV